MSKAYVLLDVDGVLNHLIAPTTARTTGLSGAWVKAKVKDGDLTPLDYISDEEAQEVLKAYKQRQPGEESFVPLHLAYESDIGQRLMSLEGDYELVWATTWNADANRLISPLVGLPDDLEVIDFSKVLKIGRAWSPLYGKTEPIVQWAFDDGKREEAKRFIWVDDQVNHPDMRYVKEKTKGRGRTLGIDAFFGLTDQNLKSVQKFVLSANEA